MTIEIIIQLIQLLVTILGLVFIWVQIKRSRKNSMSSSFITSLSERWLAIEDKRMNINEDDIKVYYKFLIPVLNNILKTKYDGQLSAFAGDFIFNDEDRILNDKDKIFNIILREYADADAIFNFIEEEFMVGKHLNLVDKKLWHYWEYYMQTPFKSARMKNYWDLRMKVGATFPAFVEFVEKNYFTSLPK